MKSIYLYVAQILMFLQSSIWEGSQECYYSSDMRCRVEIGRPTSTFVENQGMSDQSRGFRGVANGGWGC